MIKSTFLLLMLCLMTSGNVTAETFTVNNNATLIDAFNQAENGDVIVVQSGVYTIGDDRRNYTINKALTIIGESLAEPPVFNFTLNTTTDLNAPEHDLVIQNIRFEGTIDSLNFRGALKSLSFIDVTVIRSNIFINTDIQNVYIVGHRQGSSGIYISNIPNVVVAYSYLADSDLGSTSQSTETLRVSRGDNVYLIGNLISGSTNTSNTEVVNLIDNFATIYGNHFITVQEEANRSTSTRNIYTATLQFSGFGALISNNLFTTLAASNTNYANFDIDDVWYRLLSLNISGQQFPGEYIVQNNVFDSSRDRADKQGDGEAVFASYPITLKDNIFVGQKDELVFDGSANTKTASIVENNICFNSDEAACNSLESSSTITQDPLFSNVDYENGVFDYSLMADSPGIDAGLAGDLFFDVDGSRTDIGYNGGLTPFDQYSRRILDQRNNTLDTRPYIIPLIRAGQGVVGDNTLRVKLMTIARSR